MTVGRGLPRTCFREEGLALLNRIVLNISVFLWGLKASWERRKAVLVTTGQGKCIISYITNSQLSVTDHAGAETSAEIKECLICCGLAWQLHGGFLLPISTLIVI